MRPRFTNWGGWSLSRLQARCDEPPARCCAGLGVFRQPQRPVLPDQAGRGSAQIPRAGGWPGVRGAAAVCQPAARRIASAMDADTGAAAPCHPAARPARAAGELRAGPQGFAMVHAARAFCEWQRTAPVRREIARYLRGVLLSDELIMQTLVRNGPWRDRVAPHYGREIVWPGPKVMSLGDWPYLKESPEFSRGNSTRPQMTKSCACWRGTPRRRPPAPQPVPKTARPDRGFASPWRRSSETDAHRPDRPVAVHPAVRPRPRARPAGSRSRGVDLWPAAEAGTRRLRRDRPGAGVLPGQRQRCGHAAAVAAAPRAEGGGARGGHGAAAAPARGRGAAGRGAFHVAAAARGGPPVPGRLPGNRAHRAHGPRHPAVQRRTHGRAATAQHRGVSAAVRPPDRPYRAGPRTPGGAGTAGGADRVPAARPDRLGRAAAGRRRTRRDGRAAHLPAVRPYPALQGSRPADRGVRAPSPHCGQPRGSG